MYAAAGDYRNRRLVLPAMQHMQRTSRRVGPAHSCQFRQPNTHRIKQIPMLILFLDNKDREILRELVLGDLVALNELPAYEKREAYYQERYARQRRLAEIMQANLGQLPRELEATAKQAAESLAAEKAHRADLKRMKLAA
jgi:hypothetical protein